MIQKIITIDYAYNDELENIRTGNVAIGTYDETVSEAVDDTIFYYFENEEEFNHAKENGTEEFKIIDVA